MKKRGKGESVTCVLTKKGDVLQSIKTAELTTYMMVRRPSLCKGLSKYIEVVFSKGFNFVLLTFVSHFECMKIEIMNLYHNGSHAYSGRHFKVRVKIGKP